jgi:hypothetical protein
MDIPEMPWIAALGPSSTTGGANVAPVCADAQAHVNASHPRTESRMGSRLLMLLEQQKGLRVA